MFLNIKMLEERNKKTDLTVNMNIQQNLKK